MSLGARAGSAESLDKYTVHVLRRKTALKISKATTSFHCRFVKKMPGFVDSSIRDQRKA